MRQVERMEKDKEAAVGPTRKMETLPARSILACRPDSWSAGRSRPAGSPAPLQTQPEVNTPSDLMSHVEGETRPLSEIRTIRRPSYLPPRN